MGKNSARRCLWLTKGLGRGGVERLLVDMFPLVDSEEFVVDVAYGLPWKDSYRSTLEDLGADVQCLGAGRLHDPRWLGRLRRQLARRSYDVVHTHAPLPAVAARLATIGLNESPAFVHTEHNVWSRYRLPTRLLNSATYGRNASVIAVSAAVADSIEPPGKTPPPVSTILHGTVLDSIRSLSDEERSAGRSKLGLNDRDFVIGQVANLAPKKDHANLFHALATAELADVKLVLVGLGPLEDRLRQLAGELDISERVSFLGLRDDVFDLLPLFDMFVLSSEFEGFPISLVEAMASGVPCVATAVGGIPEILVDGVNGLLVPPKDHLRLREAVERLKTDAALAEACAKEGRIAAERIDLRNAVKEMEAVYRYAIDHR